MLHAEDFMNNMLKATRRRCRNLHRENLELEKELDYQRDMMDSCLADNEKLSRRRKSLRAGCMRLRRDNEYMERVIDEMVERQKASKRVTECIRKQRDEYIAEVVRLRRQLKEARETNAQS